MKFRGGREINSIQPLPHGGIDVLVDFITHQDLVTWTALSIFLAAEVILLGFFLQALTSNPITIGTISTIGLFVTIASLAVHRRSNAYMAAYISLAKKRCHPDDIAIFEVEPAGWFSAKGTMTALHILFLVLWGTFTIAYLVAIYFPVKP